MRENSVTTLDIAPWARAGDHLDSDMLVLALGSVHRPTGAPTQQVPHLHIIPPPLPHLHGVNSRV